MVKISRRGSNQYSSRVRLVAEKYEKNVSGKIRHAATQYIETLILTAPVDTSLLASNFVVSLDGPSRGLIAPYYPGSKGSTASQSKGAALAAAIDVIITFDFKTHNGIFVTNNTPYLRFQSTLDKEGALLSAKLALKG